MLKLRKNKKGFLLLEAVLMLAVMTALAFGMMTIMVGNFGTLSAAQEANQAQQLAEYIASMLRQDGFENVEDFDMQESPVTANDFVGDSTDLKNKYLYTVKKLSEFDVKDDSNNKVKLMEVKIYPEGHSDVPLYTLQVPLSSQAWAVPVGAVMAWPSEETPTSGGVWLECNGQTIPSEYKRLRELVGDHTPNYQGVFLRGYGSQTANVNQGTVVGNRNQTFSSGNLGEIQNDTTRWQFANEGDRMLLGEKDYNATLADPIGVLAFGTGEYRMVTHPGTTWHVDDPSGAVFGQSGIMNLKGDNGTGFRHWHGNLWFMEKPPKKYRLEGGGEGGSVSLVEEDDIESGFEMFTAFGDWAYWPEVGTPTSSENRPINKAVRYFIKAR